MTEAIGTEPNNDDEAQIAFDGLAIQWHGTNIVHGASEFTVTTFQEVPVFNALAQAKGTYQRPATQQVLRPDRFLANAELFVRVAARWLATYNPDAAGPFAERIAQALKAGAETAHGANSDDND